MSSEAVAAIVKYGGKILVGKKKDGTGYLSGKWHIPGGSLELGESDENGLIREIGEEAGIKIRVLRYMASHQTPTHTEVRWYECIAETNDIVPGSDLEEVKWVPRNSVRYSCDVDAVSLWPEEIHEYFR